jgi:hypothetical protein
MVKRIGLVLLAAAVLAVPAGYGLTRAGGTGETAVAETSDQSANDAAADKSFVESLTPEDLAAREAIAAGPPKGATEADEVNHVSDSPVPQSTLDRCQDVLSSGKQDILCEVEVAKANGELPPGNYSDSELEQALSR